MNNQSFTLLFESNDDKVKLINLLHDANPTQASAFSVEVGGIGVSVAIDGATEKEPVVEDGPLPEKPVTTTEIE